MISRVRVVLRTQAGSRHKSSSQHQIVSWGDDRKHNARKALAFIYFLKVLFCVLNMAVKSLIVSVVEAGMGKKLRKC